MWGCNPYFDSRHNQDGRVVSSTLRPYFSSKEIPWHPFLLQVDWAPGLLNADRKIKSLENFQGLHYESNPGHPGGAVPEPTAPPLALLLYIQGGSNMTGTNCDLFTHRSSRSYLNHLVFTYFLRNFITIRNEENYINI
jgi:hypothetical protein